MGATPYRPLSCVTTNSKAAITTTAMSAIVIAISIAPPGWSSVSNRLCNAAHQARTFLPPIESVPFRGVNTHTRITRPKGVFNR